LRTVAPIRCARLSHADPRPRPRAANSVATGPVPFRTALGAGRLDLERPFDDDFRRVWLPDDRVFEEVERVVLLLDDAGGEDVRVAMLPNVHRCHTSPSVHTPGGRAGSR
jgi:hypothetical protein